MGRQSYRVGSGNVWVCASGSTPGDATRHDGPATGALCMLSNIRLFVCVFAAGDMEVQIEMDSRCCSQAALLRWSVGFCACGMSFGNTPLGVHRFPLFQIYVIMSLVGVSRFVLVARPLAMRP